ncbi:hypothetical protein H8356DRAFT_1320641 [Neocallimastix lanati (nom. inval.)]|nr:hypothetical protein H8356DRAFT_1320641 [Neocallimastix sp. JGI-2020a]
MQHVEMQHGDIQLPKINKKMITPQIMEISPLEFQLNLHSLGSFARDLQHILISTHLNH